MISTTNNDEARVVGLMFHKGECETFVSHKFQLFFHFSHHQEYMSPTAPYTFTHAYPPVLESILENKHNLNILNVVLMMYGVPLYRKMPQRNGHHFVCNQKQASHH